MIRFILPFLFLTLFVAADGLSDESGPMDAELAFRQQLDLHLELNQRMENVAYRILKTNLSECSQTSRSVGMKVHTIFDYPSEIQMLARVYLDLDRQPTIRIIADGSPADKVGLKAGDKILRLGEYDIPNSDMAGELFDGLAQTEFTYNQTNIKISRGGTEMNFELYPEDICGYPGQIFYSDFANAHTDGEEILLTSELVSQLNDDVSLALVFAHELAHITRHHFGQPPSKELELMADQYSIYYVWRAGFDPVEAVEQWKSNPLNHYFTPSQTHPDQKERLQILIGTMRVLKGVIP